MKTAKSELIKLLALILRICRAKLEFKEMLVVFKSIVKSTDSPSITEKGDIKFKTAKESEVELPFSRFVRRRLNLDGAIVSDHVLAFMNSEIKAYHLYHTYSFRVLRGKDIPSAYFTQIGGNSCMTERPGHTRLYEENPDKVEMLVLDNASYKLKTARALVWTLADGTRLLDRVYPSDGGDHLYVFHKWAKFNNAKIRAIYGAPSTGSAIRFIHPDDFDAESRRRDPFEMGSREERSSTSSTDGHSIDLIPTSTGLFPFLDSFHYGEFIEGMLRLYTYPKQSSRLLVFNKTSGLYSIGWVCEECHRLTVDHASRLRHGKQICERCWCNGLKTCEACGGAYPETGIAGSFKTAFKSGRPSVLCKDCVDFKLSACPCCGTLDMKDRFCSVRDKDKTIQVCSPCYRSSRNCSKCGAFTPATKLTSIRNGNSYIDVCSSCLDSYNIVCNACGKSYLFKGAPENMAKAKATYKCPACKRPSKQPKEPKTTPSELPYADLSLYMKSKFVSL